MAVHGVEMLSAVAGNQVVLVVVGLEALVVAGLAVMVVVYSVMLLMLLSLLVILMPTVVLTVLNSTTSSPVAVLMAISQLHGKSIAKLTIKHQNTLTLAIFEKTSI
jgi:hypothetical protein